MAAKSSRKANGFDLAQTVCYLLRYLDQHATDLFSQEAAGEELTRPQFMVLTAVEQHEGISQTALVELTKIDRSTLAEMIRRMIADKGLLNRERLDTDARANAVRITGAGRKALRAGRAANERVEKNILNSLPAADRARFVKYLSILAAAAETSSAKARRARRRIPVR